MSHRAGPGCSPILRHSPGSRREGWGGAGPPALLSPQPREGGGGRARRGRSRPLSRLPARHSLPPSKVEQRSGDHGDGCAGLPGLPKPRLVPAMGARPRTHSAVITLHEHRAQAPTAPDTHLHTERTAHTHSPKPAGEHIHAGSGKPSRGAPLHPPALRGQCPPLTWAGRRRAGGRQRTGDRAGGAAAPPSYGTGTGQGGTGRDRTGRPRRGRAPSPPAPPPHRGLLSCSGPRAGGWPDGRMISIF